MHGIAGYFLSLLAYHLPTLLALLVGVMLAISNWHRARKAALLMLGAAAIIFMTTTGFAMLAMVLAALDLGEGSTSLGLGYAGSWLQGIGIALLVFAVFTGRDEVRAKIPVDENDELVMTGLDEDEPEAN
jgi:hypothetical protein